MLLHARVFQGPGERHKQAKHWSNGLQIRFEGKRYKRNFGPTGFTVDGMFVGKPTLSHSVRGER